MVLFGFAWTAVQTSFGQQPNLHFKHKAGLPPGNVAAMRNAERVRQPVEIRAPQGCLVSFAVDYDFAARQTAPKTVGLNVGSVYRFRLEEIPYHPGSVLYPSIEIIDRINTPPGKELEFPIVVELTQEDLELAISGNFVTRVVYLENPETASNVRSDEKPVSQDAPLGTDPVIIATTLGKPVAIVRIGGRLPDLSSPDPGYFFGSPSWTDYGSFTKSAPVDGGF